LSDVDNETISSSEEGPATNYKLSFERKIVVRQGSVTETPQSFLSCEACVELRRNGFDETNILTGARLWAA